MGQDSIFFYGNKLLYYEGIIIEYKKEEEKMKLILNKIIKYEKIKYLMIKKNYGFYIYDTINFFHILNNYYIKKNLISLTLILKSELSLDSINIINNFESLKIIVFKYIHFIGIFDLNIKDLDYLELKKCKRIRLFSETNESKIKELEISETDLIFNKNKIKFSFINKYIKDK